jgi:hypothetical protein
LKQLPLPSVLIIETLPELARNGSSLGDEYCRNLTKVRVGGATLI